MNPVPLRNERTTEEWAAPVLLLAMKALNQRALLWCVAIGAGVAWGYTIVHVDPWRILAASLYSVTVLLPFLFRDRGGV